MAMDKTILGQSLKSKITSAITGVDPSDPTYADKVYEAIADAIIEHITTYMEITIPQSSNTGIVVSPPSSVTSQGFNPEQTIGPGSGIE